MVGDVAVFNDFEARGVAGALVRSPGNSRPQRHKTVHSALRTTGYCTMHLLQALVSGWPQALGTPRLQEMNHENCSLTHYANMQCEEGAFVT
jgi:hypothetical protein